MTVCVLGLGYVGTVIAATLARRGHAVLGVDIDAAKVNMLGQGRASFAEPGLDAAIATAGGRLKATHDVATALTRAEEIIVCVGTPTGADGRPDLRAIDRVAQQIGEALRTASTTVRTIVVRSTIPPGTTMHRVRPAIEAASGRAHGDGWHLLFSPEFLREGSALADVEAPPQTIIGALAPDHARPYLARLGPATGPVVHTSPKAAELLKYAANAFHGLKVAFANEVGAVAAHLGADGREVMQLVCRDTTLNLSAAYLRPGGPFGGSCLPKDLRALERLATDGGISVPLLSSVLPANAMQLRRLVDAVVASGARRVGLVGLAFKDGTDDLRESPWVELVRRLRLDGREVWIVDPHVSPSALRGRNRRFAELGVPSLPDMLVPNIGALLPRCDALVLARNIDPRHIPHDYQATMIDVAGNDVLADRPGYRALAW